MKTWPLMFFNNMAYGFWFRIVHKKYFQCHQKISIFLILVWYSTVRRQGNSTRQQFHPRKLHDDPFVSILPVTASHSYGLVNGFFLPGNVTQSSRPRPLHEIHVSEVSTATDTSKYHAPYLGSTPLQLREPGLPNSLSWIFLDWHNLKISFINC